MEYPRTTNFYRRNLPHWHVSERSYFITFRLKNSIPKEVLEDLKEKYSRIKSETEETKLNELYRTHFLKYEKVLDSAKENLYLNDPRIARLIIEGFEWIEINTGWEVPSFTVMPNHVHCLMTSRKAVMSFNSALRILKGFTARKANLLLNRTGSFWTPENFDHWCRSPEKEESVKKYIRNNPVRAGLVKSADDWPWKK